MRRLAYTLLLAGLCVGCSPEPSADVHFATVAVRLEVEDPLGCVPAASCSEWCVDRAAANFFRVDDFLSDVPFGPGATAECGDPEPMVSNPVLAGHLVWVSASMSQGPTRRFEGNTRDAPVVVLANGLTTVDVPLAPTSVPLIAALSPDPLLAGHELVISGSGFGSGLGLSRVEIDCEGLASISWSDSEVRLVLPEGQGGDAIRVRRCGLYSPLSSIRLLANNVRESPLSPPGCDGFDVRALTLAPAPNELLVLAACGSGAGSALRFVPSSCGYGTTAELPGIPAAATSFQDAAYVAIEGGSIVRLDAAGAVTETGWASGEVLALAADASTVWAITATGLHAVGGAKVDAVAADLELRDMASSGQALLIAARDDSGAQGKLVVIESGGAPVEYVLPDCAQPRAVDARPGSPFVAVACDGGIAGFDLANKTLSWRAQPDLLPKDVSLDGNGDVAFAVDGRLVGAGLADGRALGERPLSASGSRLFFSGAGHQLVLGGGATLTLLAPYAGAAPCEATP